MFTSFKNAGAQGTLNRGLTLPEIIVVVAIVGLLAALTAATLPKFGRQAELNSSAEAAVSLLSEARARTLSSEDESQFGVYFQHDRAVLFKGTVYASTSPDNKESVFSRSVELSVISLSGGGTEVLFSRLTGETNEYGTLVFELRSDASKRSTTTILETGIASN